MPLGALVAASVFFLEIIDVFYLGGWFLAPFFIDGGILAAKSHCIDNGIGACLAKWHCGLHYLRVGLGQYYGVGTVVGRKLGAVDVPAADAAQHLG